MEDGFQIFIALPTDDVCTLRGLSDNMRIYQLKSRVELKTGIPGDIQHLYFMNKELFDDFKLEDVIVKQGCIVRVKLESTWSNLFEACWTGDIYEVFQNGVQFLDENEFKGYNIALWNRLVIQRATNALFIASHRGFLGLVIELLNHGAADINGKTRFGRTCLHVASYQGFVGCVSLLLSEGALCNQVDFNGKTPLALASENGHIYCERRLWLYQMNLKKHATAPRKFSEDPKTMKETKENLNERIPLSSSGKGLHLHGNKARLAQGEERQDNKKIEFHLPRVQTTDGQICTSSTSSPEQREQSSRSQFPLVQIAEKYRREFKELKESNLPNMDKKEGPGAQRPKTAPDPIRGLKNERKETRSKYALEQVEEANTAHLKQDEQHAQKKDSQETKENVPVKESKVSSNSMEQANLQQQEGQEENNIERPQSRRGSNLRHLDVVMSSSRVRSKSAEARPLKPDLKISQELPCPPSEPAINHEYMDVTEHAYRPRKPAQTFDTWLENKRNKGQLRPATAHAPEKSKLGKSIDPEAFKSWLNKKRHNHYRRYSESSNNGPKKTYISSGLTFDKWLEEKRKMAGKDRDCHVGESNESTKKPRVILAGKSYEEWLNEKLTQAQSQSKENDEENNNNGQKNGKTFEMWLLEKKNQKQIERIHKATTEKERQRRLEYEQYQRYLNPSYRTFDEWLAIKRQENLLERVRAENEPKEADITSEDKKKDAGLVFDIWLTMKFVQEMKAEEENYKEMKEKWERREKQRAYLRRAIHMNKLMKQQNKSNDYQSCKMSNGEAVVDDVDEIMECI